MLIVKKIFILFAKIKNKDTLIMRKPRILVFTDLPGTGLIYAEAFRKLGYRASLLSYQQNWHSYVVKNKCDIYMDLENERFEKFFIKISLIRPIIKIFLLIVQLISKDSFVFLSNISLLPNYWDLPIIKFFKKKIAIIYVGCDIRCRDIIMKENRPFPLCKHCPFPCDMLKKEALVRRAEKYADVIFSQPEYSQLLRISYEYWFVPIDTEELKPNYVCREIPLVVHATGRRGAKGTRFILRVIEQLKKEGIKFEFLLLEGIPNQLVLEKVKEADIVIDQVINGWYGLFSTESMALGKPVLCYIIEKYKKEYEPNLPIVNTDRNHIAENLKTLIENSELRLKIAKESRVYAEEFHNSRRVASELINKLYKT
jgi:hypothetical protein